MTIQEAILIRSYLPQNGTRTMEEHLFAMVAGGIVGTVGQIAITPQLTRISVATNKASVKVKEDIIAINVAMTTDNVLTSSNVSDIRIV